MLKVLKINRVFKRLFSGVDCPVKSEDEVCKAESTKIVECSKNVAALELYAEEAIKNSLAIIKPRSKMVTQQGTDYLGTWEITFDTKERWENPTMGWTSCGHSLSNLVLNFPDQESAIEFGRRRGWNLLVEREPKKAKFKPKSYAEIYSYNRRTRASTK